MKKIGIFFLVLLLLLTACAKPEGGDSDAASVVNTGGGQEEETDLQVLETTYGDGNSPLYTSTVALVEDWVCFDQKVFDRPGTGVYIAQLWVDKTPRLLIEDASVLGHDGKDLFVRKGNQILWYDLTESESTWNAAVLAEEENAYFCGTWQEKAFFKSFRQEKDGSLQWSLHTWAYKTKSGLYSVPSTIMDYHSKWLITGDTAYFSVQIPDAEGQLTQRMAYAMNLETLSAEPLGTIPCNDVVCFAQAEDGTLFGAANGVLYVRSDSWEPLTEYQRCSFNDGKAYLGYDRDGQDITEVWSLKEQACVEVINGIVHCGQDGMLIEDASAGTRVWKWIGADGEEITYPFYGVTNKMELSSVGYVCMMPPGKIIAAKWEGGSRFEFSFVAQE